MCDGTISELRQALLEMKRTDAVNIIDRAKLERQGEPTLTMLGTRCSATSARRPKPVAGEGIKLFPTDGGGVFAIGV